MSHTAVRPRSRHAAPVALFTSILVVISGIFAGPISASAAEPAAVTPTVTSVVAETSVTMSVTATGLPVGVTSVYAALIEKGRESDIAMGGGYTAFAMPFPAVTDGATSFVLTASATGADALKKGAQYEVLIWKQHSNPGPENIYGRADVALNWDELFPPETVPAVDTSIALTTSAERVEFGEAATLTATVAPNSAAGTVTFMNGGEPLGSAVTVDAGVATQPVELPVGEHPLTAVFAPADDAAWNGSTSTTVIVTVVDRAVAPVWSPTIQVFAADGVTPLDPTTPIYDEDEIVIVGSGFDPAANVGGRGIPIPSTLPQGTYVVFGSFLDDWTPSSGAPASARKAGPQGWVLTEDTLNAIPQAYRETVRKQWVELAADGSFRTTLTVAAVKNAPADGNYGIYTYGAAGVLNADQELEFRLNYQGERPVEQTWDPSIEVFLADGVTPVANSEVFEGDTLVIKGSGFNPYANLPENAEGGMPIPNSLPQGTFAVFGSFGESWKPSTGALSSQRQMEKSNRAWLLAKDTLDQVPEQFRDVIRGQWSELDPQSGSFVWAVTLKSPQTQPADGKFGIYTYAGGAGQVTNAAQEIAVPLNYQGSRAEQPEVPETGATGGLVWSFKSSWNFYFKNIANGTLTASHGATAGSNGEVGYTQVEGGDFDIATGLGTIRYQGTARYVSEMHGFDIAFSDPWVVFADGKTTMTGKVSATDTAGVTEMVRVPVATLDTSSPVVGEDEVRSWTDVPGTFDAALQPTGWEQYALTAIDPITFSFGAEGIDPVESPVVNVSSTQVQQGKTITFTGAGFTAGDAVTATVFSDPIVLGTQSAAADGSVLFEWTVPTNFAVGAHTVELTTADGAKASATFDVQARPGAIIDPVVNAPAEVCVARSVVGGSLQWAVKQSFRDYVTGRIAKGTFTGGTFAASSGAMNVRDNGIGRTNFSGAISATGHNGLLNFQLTNPSVQITGPGSGTLYAHVKSTSTSGGAAVDGVISFANLSFSGPEISGDSLTVSGAAAVLTEAGSGALAGFYPAGTSLDPMSFALSLGSEVACDATTDPASAAKLASTGTADQSVLMAGSLAAMALLIGAGLMLSRRRRLANHN